MESLAIAQGIRQIFLLRTQTAVWFREQLFVLFRLDELPM
jgi:N-acetylglutamate synthase-like GNAT family acetyltransferase